jgi:hypothetical protein
MLDAVCAHMASAPAHDPLAPRHEAQLHWFQGVCDSIKRRILQERSDSASTLRTEDSAYDTVHSLGQREASIEGRFRPVNAVQQVETPVSVQAHNVPDPFTCLDGGVLSEGFWNNFLVP